VLGYLARTKKEERKLLGCLDFLLDVANFFSLYVEV